MAKCASGHLYLDKGKGCPECGGIRKFSLRFWKQPEEDLNTRLVAAGFSLRTNGYVHDILKGLRTVARMAGEGMEYVYATENEKAHLRALVAGYVEVPKSLAKGQTSKLRAIARQFGYKVLYPKGAPFADILDGSNRVAVIDMESEGLNPTGHEPGRYLVSEGYEDVARALDAAGFKSKSVAKVRYDFDPDMSDHSLAEVQNIMRRYGTPYTNRVGGVSYAHTPETRRRIEERFPGYMDRVGDEYGGRYHGYERKSEVAKAPVHFRALMEAVHMAGYVGEHMGGGMYDPEELHVYDASVSTLIGVAEYRRGAYVMEEEDPRLEAIFRRAGLWRVDVGKIAGRLWTADGHKESKRRKPTTSRSTRLRHLRAHPKISMFDGQRFWDGAHAADRADMLRRVGRSIGLEGFMNSSWMQLPSDVRYDIESRGGETQYKGKFSDYDLHSELRESGFWTHHNVNDPVEVYYEGDRVRGSPAGRFWYGDNTYETDVKVLATILESHGFRREYAGKGMKDIMTGLSSSVRAANMTAGSRPRWNEFKEAIRNHGLEFKDTGFGWADIKRQGTLIAQLDYNSWGLAPYPHASTHDWKVVAAEAEAARFRISYHPSKADEKKKIAKGRWDVNSSSLGAGPSEAAFISRAESMGFNVVHQGLDLMHFMLGGKHVASLGHDGGRTQMIVLVKLRGNSTRGEAPGGTNDLMQLAEEYGIKVTVVGMAKSLRDGCMLKLKADSVPLHANARAVSDLRQLGITLRQSSGFDGYLVHEGEDVATYFGNSVDLYGEGFLGRTPAEIDKWILEICSRNGVEVEGAIVGKSATKDQVYAKLKEKHFSWREFPTGKGAEVYDAAESFAGNLIWHYKRFEAWDPEFAEIMESLGWRGTRTWRKSDIAKVDWRAVFRDCREEHVKVISPRIGTEGVTYRQYGKNVAVRNYKGTFVDIDNPVMEKIFDKHGVDYTYAYLNKSANKASRIAQLRTAARAHGWTVEKIYGIHSLMEGDGLLARLYLNGLYHLSPPYDPKVAEFVESFGYKRKMSKNIVKLDDWHMGDEIEALGFSLKSSRHSRGMVNVRNSANGTVAAYDDGSYALLPASNSRRDELKAIFDKYGMSEVPSMAMLGRRGRGKSDKEEYSKVRKCPKCGTIVPKDSECWTCGAKKSKIRITRYEGELPAQKANRDTRITWLLRDMGYEMDSNAGVGHGHEIWDSSKRADRAKFSKYDRTIRVSDPDVSDTFVRGMEKLASEINYTVVDKREETRRILGSYRK